MDLQFKTINEKFVKVYKITRKNSHKKTVFQFSLGIFGGFIVQYFRFAQL